MEQESVIIPKEIVEQSVAKSKKRRTARQSEVYRDVANLKFIIVKTMADAPRKYAKYYDEILMTVNNAKQSLALALEFGDGMSRSDNLSYAKVMIDDIQDDAVILFQLGVISKNQKKTIRKLAQKIAGQTVRLRDYFKSQGIDTTGKTV